MKVNLTYFKQSGKYYSQGSYETNEIDMEDIWAEVRKNIQMEDLPNLTKDPSDFIILVNVPEHQDNVMKLFGLNNYGGINTGDIKNSTIVSGSNN